MTDSFLINPFNLTPVPFSPAVVSGCRLWLDASDAATVHATGSSVDQWDDKSGYGFHVVGTGTVRPSTGVNTINGLNVLTFAGGNDNLHYTGTTGVNVGAVTVFVVAQEASAVTNAGIFVMHDSTGNDYSSNNAILHDTSDVNNLFQAFRKQTDGGNAAIAGTGLMPAAIWMSRSSATTLRVYKNGGTPGTRTQSETKGVAAGGYLVGQRFLSGAISTLYAMNGYIAEIAVYNVELSADNTNLVGQFLADKWGFTWSTVS